MTNEPSLPLEHPPRLDFSRCRTYAVSKAEEAMGLFKLKYGVAPTLCIAAPIGGRTRVEGWTCGYIPLDWSEDETESKDRAGSVGDVGEREGGSRGQE